MDHILGQGMRHGGRRGRIRPELAAASANETFVGRDQRDVGVDPAPAVAREHLHIEMQMAAVAVGVVQIVRYHADFLALVNAASVQKAIGIHGNRAHMHVAETDMFGARVDLQRRRLLFQRADHDAVADSNDRPLPGITAVGTIVTGRARRRANILALMAKSAWALSDAKTSGFAKTILPRIAGLAASQLIERSVARPAVSE